MRNRDIAPVFKPYDQTSRSFLPPSLEDLIPANHPVRVVNRIIDSLSIDTLISGYKGGGCSSYHPVCLLKIIVYSYLRNIYSSRKMEEALHDNIHFMWLSGQSTPDHNTLARFRSGHLRKHLQEIFTQIVHLLVEEGLVSLKQVFIDGTKVESAANRYTFVWGKAIKTSKERIAKQINELMEYADQVSQSESSDPEVQFTEVNSEKIKAVLETIDRKLEGIEVPTKVKAKIRYAKKKWPDKLEQYSVQEELLDQRNSYSKTDPDATFMRTKDDHMGNGQLKPCYNVQISTENQYVTNFSIHQNPTDTKTLKPHLELFEKAHGTMPKIVVADAGYGSQENLEHLENKEIEAYVKYSQFHQEQKKGRCQWDVETWEMSEDQNEIKCPNNERLTLIGTRIQSQGDYKFEVHQFGNKSCLNCPFKGECNPKYDHKTVEVRLKLRDLRGKARTRLTSEEGVRLRKQRCVEVESVFGQIKSNRNFKRFLMRGLDKVSTEWGLLCIAHNLRKMAIQMA